MDWARRQPEAKPFVAKMKELWEIVKKATVMELGAQVLHWQWKRNKKGGKEPEEGAKVTGRVIFAIDSST